MTMVMNAIWGRTSEEAVMTYFEALSQHFPRGTEENKKVCHNSWSLDRSQTGYIENAC